MIHVKKSKGYFKENTKKVAYSSVNKVDTENTNI